MGLRQQGEDAVCFVEGGLVGVGRAVAEGVVVGGLGVVAGGGIVPSVKGKQGEMVVDVSEIEDEARPFGDG